VATWSPVGPGTPRATSSEEEEIGYVPPVELMSDRSVIPDGDVNVLTPVMPKNARTMQPLTVVETDGAATDALATSWTAPEWTSTGAAVLTPE
jgi:hypothetical protein